MITLLNLYIFQNQNVPVDLFVSSADRCYIATQVNSCTSRSETHEFKLNDIDRAPFEKKKNIDRWTHKEIVVIISPGFLSGASCNSEC